jgi:hypothetical protein
MLGAGAFGQPAFTGGGLSEAMAAGGDEAKRAFEAMMGKKTIHVAEVERARRGCEGVAACADAHTATAGAGSCRNEKRRMPAFVSCEIST